ncbi:MAG: hypothetical protein M1833_002252 [Piccolia ochrophora]|nr:MAG: hypothetical protein M1833_002252 [Piccolia ochrophora]
MAHPLRLTSFSCQICRPCRSRLWHQAFSTSAAAAVVGPESPKFIEIPQPPQQRPASKPHVKGFLPVPRNIFPARSSDKGSGEYLTQATPEPKRVASVRDSAQPANTDHPEYSAWKSRLAATRRRSLRESLVELKRQKEQTERTVSLKTKRTRAEREKLLHRRQREDDRLTSPTVTAATKQLQQGIAPDPDRSARLAEKTAKVHAIEARRSEDRRAALHTLYINARKFITTEEQLADEIERVFVESPQEWAEHYPGRNIWNRGPPETIQEMLDVVNKAEKRAVALHSGFAELSARRVNRIAEELTGGKLDEESERPL